MVCDSVAGVASVCFRAVGVCIEMCLSRRALWELDLLVTEGDGTFLARVTGVGTVYGVLDAVVRNSTTPCPAIISSRTYMSAIRTASNENRARDVNTYSY